MGAEAARRSKRGRLSGTAPLVLGGTLTLSFAAAALAGPPYISDDPEPTDYRHYEIYLFAAGSEGPGNSGREAGIDFNYGGAPDLQLTAVVPVTYQRPSDATTGGGVGNVELAAKYRFLHQSGAGWDVAFFPRLFLPNGSEPGEQHFALLLPFWVEKDWGKWSTFGGGGCEINKGGGGSRNFCLAGWVLARQLLPDLQLGIEIAHQGADTDNGHPATEIGLGLHYDVAQHFHVLAYAAPTIENASENGRYSWYAALLLTF